MAEVWLAHDAVHGQLVALKRALPFAGSEARDALLREADIGRQLRHPNIVEVLDGGEADGLPFLVSEYVEGPSLREVLNTRGPLAEREVRAIGQGVAAALSLAHRQGVTHNDLKPENILLGVDGPKVTDFGAASSLTQTVGPERARELMGTLAYLAPEVLQGAAPSPRSDVYALGLTLYESAAGRLPFAGSTPAAIAGQRLAQGAPPLRALAPAASAELEAALVRALQPDPAARFADAGEFAAALRGAPVVSHPTVVIRRATPPPPQPQASSTGGKRRNGGVIAASLGLVGLLLAGGALAFALVGNDDDREAPLVQGVPTATATAMDPTATPTATEPPPTATPTSKQNGDRNSGNSGNSGQGEEKKKDQKKPKDPKPNDFWTSPSPGSAQEALSYIFDTLRQALEGDE